MKTLKNSIFDYFLYSLVLGIIYPFVIIFLGGLLLKEKAGGSLVYSNNVIVGSKFVGQQFSQDKYFWGRPSSTSPTAYNPASSSGSNQSLTNPALQKAFMERVSNLGNSETAIPVDLITGSGSGLDPEISPASAKFQVKRIAKARNINEKVINEIIQRNLEDKFIGVFGERRLNVLRLNIELDEL